MDKTMKGIKEGKGLEPLPGYQPTETLCIAHEDKIVSNGNVAQKADNPFGNLHPSGTFSINVFNDTTKRIVLRLYERNVPTDKFIVRNLYIPDGDWRIEGELNEQI